MRSIETHFLSYKPKEAMRPRRAAFVARFLFVLINRGKWRLRALRFR